MTGYRPTCRCHGLYGLDHHDPVPCRVLDPFSGTSTVGQVCQYLGCHFTGIELYEKYALMAAKRIQTPWKPKEKRTPKKARKQASQRSLF